MIELVIDNTKFVGNTGEDGKYVSEEELMSSITKAA